MAARQSPPGPCRRYDVPHADTLLGGLGLNGASPDLVGIGMINVDHIVDSRGNASPVALPAAFERGSDRAARDDEIRHAIEQMKPLRPQLRPGGSSLNALAAAVETSAGIRAGVIGVCGQPDEEGAFDFRSWFGLLNLDDHFVSYASVLPGTCVSYSLDGERSMLTWSGANRALDAHIGKHHAQLLRYLGGARIVHIAGTSNDVPPDRGPCRMSRTAAEATTAFSGSNVNHSSTRSCAGMGMTRKSSVMFVLPSWRLTTRICLSLTR